MTIDPLALPYSVSLRSCQPDKNTTLEQSLKYASKLHLRDDNL